MPPGLEEIATSLRMETGEMHSRLEVLIRLLRHMDRYYNQFLSERPDADFAAFCGSVELFSGEARAHHDGAGNFYGKHRGAGIERSVARVAR